jgi:hypothetical protein
MKIRFKKDPAAGCFGVAQSPKLPHGGINLIMDADFDRSRNRKEDYGGKNDMRRIIRHQPLPER